MAGMICPEKGCGHSSNDARPPRCTMPSCPGRETFALSDFQKKPASERLENLKAAFAENEIPWPPFQRSRERTGWPDPTVNDLSKLTDAELANYIAVSGYEYDGMGASVREALVRLLHRAACGEHTP